MLKVRKRADALVGRERGEPRWTYNVYGAQRMDGVLYGGPAGIVLTYLLIYKNNQFQWVKALDYEPALD